MESNSTELKSSLNNSTQTRSSALNKPTVENDCILETLIEILDGMVEEIFNYFPEINENNIIKHFTDIGKFLLIHNTTFDSKSMKFFEEGCKKSIKNFNWDSFLKKKLFSQWRNLFLRNSIRAPGDQNESINDLINESKKSLNIILNLSHSHINLTQMTSNIFPTISEFDEFFLSISEKLKEKTFFIYNKLHERSDTNPPRIQKAQVEDLTNKQKRRTEWMNFSESLEETIQISHYKCSFGNCCKRLFSRPVLSKTVSCVYTGPVGWEITRVFTEIADGRFTNILIQNSSISENKVYIDVEVQYHQFGTKEVWFSLKVEGSSVRKKMYESKVSEIKEFLVIVDQFGSHEIPEEI